MQVRTVNSALWIKREVIFPTCPWRLGMSLNSLYYVVTNELAALTWSKQKHSKDPVNASFLGDCPTFKIHFSLLYKPMGVKNRRSVCKPRKPVPSLTQLGRWPDSSVPGPVAEAISYGLSPCSANSADPWLGPGRATLSSVWKTFSTTEEFIGGAGILKEWNWKINETNQILFAPGGAGKENRSQKFSTVWSGRVLFTENRIWQFQLVVTGLVPHKEILIFRSVFSPTNCVRYNKTSLS